VVIDGAGRRGLALRRNDTTEPGLVSSKDGKKRRRPTVGQTLVPSKRLSQMFAAVGLLTSEHHAFAAFSSSAVAVDGSDNGVEWNALVSLGYSGGAVPDSHRIPCLQTAPIGRGLPPTQGLGAR
jgi:hypothetical protein